MIPSLLAQFTTNQVANLAVNVFIDNPLYKAELLEILKQDSNLNTMFNQDKNPNRADSFGYTPLCVAAQHGCMRVIMFLLQDPRIDVTRGHEGSTPFEMAAESGHFHIFNLLKLHNYISILKDRINQHGGNHHHHLFSKSEGFTDGQKLAAAEALKKVMCKEADIDLLKNHEGVLNSRSLKVIYEAHKNVLRQQEIKGPKKIAKTPS